MIVGPHSTKLPQSWDTEPNQLGVPAPDVVNEFSNSLLVGAVGVLKLLQDLFRSAILLSLDASSLNPCSFWPFELLGQLQGK